MHKEVIGQTQFTFSTVDTPELLNDIFSLRYQVYCKECKFIREADYPEAKEQDKFDPYSLQFMVQDPQGVIGAARLILDSALGFPLEEHCGAVLSINKDDLPREEIAEISRLVISKEYRRRVNDGLYYSPPESQSETDSFHSQRMRPLVFGLYREIYQESKRKGIKYWYAVMEPSLWTLLKLNGFVFHPIGEVVDFYGPVRPYMASLEEVEKAVLKKYPELFTTYLLDGLELAYWPEINKREASDTSEPGLYEFFRDKAAQMPDAPAIYYKSDQSYSFHTYGDFRNEVVKLGNFLYKQGVRELDKAGILMGNSDSWPLSFMAVQYLKAIAVPLDTTLFDEELRERIFLCNPKALLCDEKTASKFSLLIEEIKKYIPVFVIDNSDTRKEIEECSSDEVFGNTPPLKNQAAVYFFTSGTTGKAKIVMLSHQNLISNACSIAQAGGLKDEDTFICLLPLYHSYALMVTCILPLLFGAKLSFPATMNPADLLECMRSTQITVLTGVPQIFCAFHHRIKGRFSNFSIIKRLFLSAALGAFWFLRRAFKINPAKLLLKELHDSFSLRLKYLITGGAHLDPQVTRDFFMWGFTILEGYGLSETSPIVAWNAPQSYKIGSVGKLLPDVEVKLFRVDKQGVGEITVKGPNVMLGYYQNPEATSKALVGGWFLSGDIGYIDKDGFLFIHGRKDELVVLSSGKKVSLEELESQYGVSKLVKEICVLALTQKGFFDNSKQLLAVVVPDFEQFPPGAGHAVIEQAIRDDFKKLSEGVSEYKRVRGLVISDKPLPRTSLGKLKRHKVETQCAYLKKTADSGPENPEADLDIAQLPESEQILKFLSERLKRKVLLNDHLELDLGFDSLGRIELLLELQKTFQIEVPEEAAMELTQARTVSELIRKIKPYLSSPKS